VSKKLSFVDNNKIFFEGGRKYLLRSMCPEAKERKKERKIRYDTIREGSGGGG